MSKYFRISVTDKCNLSCFYCHKEGNHKECIKELTPKEIQLACQIALDMGFQKFKLTGGEPTIRKDICTIISLLSELNLPDLSMITNGSTLSVLAQDLWDAGLRRLNISLNTIREEKFKNIQVSSNVPISAVLKGIETAQKVGFKNIKLNFVYFSEESDQDLEELLTYSKESGLTLVALPVLDKQNLFTLDYLYQKIKSYGIKTEELLYDGEGIRKRLIHLNSGATVLLRMDELAEQKPYQFCSQCSSNKECREGIFPIRLSANGELIPCMASQKNRIPIHHLISQGDKKGVRQAFYTINRWYRTNA